MKLLAEASARGHSNTAFDISSRLRIDRADRADWSRRSRRAKVVR